MLAMNWVTYGREREGRCQVESNLCSYREKCSNAFTRVETLRDVKGASPTITQSQGLREALRTEVLQRLPVPTQARSQASGPGPAVIDTDPPSLVALGDPPSTKPRLGSVSVAP